MVQNGARAGDQPRTSKGVGREQQILAVAEKLFHKNGYAQTSMGDIAEATGLLKGSLYYYIDSKEDLLYKIVTDVHQVSQEQLDAARALVDVSALDRIVSFVHSQLTYNARAYTRVAVYHHEWMRLEGARLTEVREGRASYSAKLESLIAMARDEGSLPADVNVKLAGNTILAIIVWPYTWFRPSVTSAKELADFGSGFVRAALANLAPLPQA
jgi:AcrR family transcriptional regulator